MKNSISDTNMSEIPNMLIRHNRVSALVISILAGVIIVYLSLIIFPDLIFAVPVVTFLILFWLKIWGIKRRVLASLVVFLAIGIISCVIVSEAVYTSNGAISNVPLPNGSVVTTSVSPYLSQGNDFNFSYYISENTTIGKFWMDVNYSWQNPSSTPGFIVPSSAFHSVTYANGTLLLYTHLKNLSNPAIYVYTLYINNGTAVNNQIPYVSNGGPVTEPSYMATLAYTLVYSNIIPGYLILFELIFLVGIFLARSISHSAQYSRRRKPPETQ